MTSSSRSTTSLLALLAVLVLMPSAVAQEWQWAHKADGPTDDNEVEGSGVVIDAAGNVYVTGEFADVADFGPVMLTTTGGKAMFVAKYAPDGSVLWAVQADGDEDSGADGESVAVDAAGNVYVLGEFTGTLNFGPVTLTSSGGFKEKNTFLAKYAPDGSVVWAERSGGSGVEDGGSIAIDAMGSVYITGAFRDLADFGTIMLSSMGGTDVFVAKYAPDGSVIWAVSAGGDDSDGGSGVAADAEGNIVVNGRFSGVANFGTITLSSISSISDMFVAKYTPDGSVVWAVQTAASMNDYVLAESIAVDAAVNVYVTGRFFGTIDFGSFPLTAAGGEDIFVAKHAPDGTVVWAERAGGVTSDAGEGIVIDAASNVYVSGWFTDVADFGPFVLTSTGESDLVVATYAPDGTVVWAEQVGGGTDEDEAENKAIAMNAEGDVYVTGLFRGTYNFAPFTLTSADDAMFVAKLSDGAVAIEPGAAPNSRALSLSPPVPNPATSRVKALLVSRDTRRGRAEVYDVLGRRVAVAYDGPLSADTPRSVVLDVSELPSGVYVLRVTTSLDAAARLFTVAR